MSGVHFLVYGILILVGSLLHLVYRIGDEEDWGRLGLVDLDRYQTIIALAVALIVVGIMTLAH